MDSSGVVVKSVNVVRSVLHLGTYRICNLFEHFLMFLVQSSVTLEYLGVLFQYLGMLFENFSMLIKFDMYCTDITCYAIHADIHALK